MTCDGATWKYSGPLPTQRTQHHTIEKFDGKEWYVIWRIHPSCGLNHTVQMFQNLATNEGGRFRLTLA